MNFAATKRKVNGNPPPDDFLTTLVTVGQRLLKDSPAVFAQNDIHDIFTNVKPQLGPWTDLIYRAACELEALRCLASLESGYNWNEGRDMSVSTFSAFTAEAGIFQCSANSMYFDKSLQALFEKHSGMKYSSINVDVGNAFQKISKSNHEFAVEYCLRLLRYTVNHHGPVKRLEINQWLSLDAALEFQSLLLGENMTQDLDFSDVKKLQIALNKLKASTIPLKVDGFKGPITTAALQRFQSHAALKATGEVDKDTNAALMRAIEAIESPVIDTGIPERPRNYDDMYRIFGDPSDSDWQRNHLVLCQVPDSLLCFPLGKLNKRGFYCHNLLAPIFKEIFTEIHDTGLGPKLYSYDGCYNYRFIRGSTTTLSLHSWATSIDLNYEGNELGELNPTMDKGIIKIFKNHGFTWGGDFNGRKDPGHFEYFNRPDRLISA